ncbi:TerB family tellurite resistance protein [Riemerella anatipestifer]|uniref:TerB family tellurite resistance protein n=1 Tax=Riemerella anatipestifer TaxID=34085 RepID=UPI00129E699C|nr:TerB family tellurite resistance protein [Riemerella anatipestifer]MBT0550861.1 TerB family tellurite resistance protein [Riemerella anatipestifer]MBT0553007.1 TerB family tellurite resistance protein [Riemerella anatipestifer]MCE3023703.1 TerB family tellurite resistance protein [Riemerella anatipestifer]MCU7541855.1 TerB family tellurite resistance protein [Riemerella anatipestifer]MCU7559646.1 TerB family tellurite resistance protein [Riemerella anatipestifer]
MFDRTEERILNAKNISSDFLIDLIRNEFPKRFDQMLIENEERKNYYYINYKSYAISRETSIVKFPLFDRWKSFFETGIKKIGEPEVLTNQEYLEDIFSRGFTPNSNEKYSEEEMPFSNLNILTENNEICLKQPVYYIPTESHISTCDCCNGNKYVICEETECKGQHIYDCNNCNATGKIDCPKCKSTGWIDCRKCNKRGEYSCSSCGGKGEKKCNNCYGSGKTSSGSKCSKCSGRGYEKCGKCRNGMIRCEKCAGKGEYRCENCSGRGEIKCQKCNGNKQITCEICYGDNIDNRYGKVDCNKCQTAGEIATISYIETEIKYDNNHFYISDGTEISVPNFNINKLKSFVDQQHQLEYTYKNYNEENIENYDPHSIFCSNRIQEILGLQKNNYPKLISEEIYYEAIPCVTFTYNHILSATQHKVSILSIDNEKEILFHSNPSSIINKKESITEIYTELLNRAFSTKRYLNKVDRKHEIFLMLHMAKSDGKIEEQEKRYLANTITGLQGFTLKEKRELFALMSESTLPPLLPSNAYFSSKARSEEAKKKIIELIANADGEYEDAEKRKLNEINEAIEKGHLVKPTKTSNFLKTWQVSYPLIILMVVFIYLLINSLIK